MRWKARKRHGMTDQGLLAERCFVRRENLPSFEPVDLNLEDLMKEGHRLAEEQENVNRLKLSEEYMKNTGGGGVSLVGLQG
jgi:hypothetical protein